MFKFARPDGTPFDLDYTGPICVFSSGNDRIAVCLGEWGDEEEEQEDLDLGILKKKCGDPARWDDWEIFTNVTEHQRPILQRAIANAWSAIALCQRLLVDISSQDQNHSSNN